MPNEIITNLHPDNDPNTNLYPNIKKENIPSKSISTDKLDDNVLSLIGSLKPSGTDTSTNILAYTSNKGIYVATDNGHWYYWNGTNYVDSGMLFQSSEDIEQLKKDLIQLRDDENKYYKNKELTETIFDFKNEVWERGGIDNSTGNPVNSNNETRLVYYFNTNNRQFVLNITKPARFGVRVYRYDENKNFLNVVGVIDSSTEKQLFVTKCAFFKIVIWDIDNTISSDDLYNYCDITYFENITISKVLNGLTHDVDFGWMIGGVDSYGLVANQKRIVMTRAIKLDYDIFVEPDNGFTFVYQTYDDNMVKTFDSGWLYIKTIIPKGTLFRIIARKSIETPIENVAEILDHIHYGYYANDTIENSTGKYTRKYRWENGSINSSTGLDDGTSKKYYRSEFISDAYNKYLCFTIEKGFILRMFFYNSDKSYATYKEFQTINGYPMYTEWFITYPYIRFVYVSSGATVDLNINYVEKLNFELKNKTNIPTKEDIIVHSQVGVSDFWHHKSGDGTQMVIDDKNSLAYIVYNTSESAYGERKEVLALSIFPVYAPFDIKRKVLFKVNQQVGDYTFTTFGDMAIVLLDNFVRVFFDAVVKNETGFKEYYMDINRQTFEISNPSIVKVYLPNNSTAQQLSTSLIKTYTESNGYTQPDDYRMVFSSNFAEYNGKHYVVFTGGSETSKGYVYPCVAWTDDFCYFHITGIIPFTLEWEAQIAILDGIMYILARGMKSKSSLYRPFITSNDLGLTFTGHDFYWVGNTRPQMRVYKNKIITFTSLMANYNSDYKSDDGGLDRRGFVIRMGTGTNPDDYKEVGRFYDSSRLFYYCVCELNRKLYISTCRGNLYDSMPNGGSKDSVCFTKIGEISENCELILN